MIKMYIKNGSDIRKENHKPCLSRRIDKYGPTMGGHLERVLVGSLGRFCYDRNNQNSIPYLPVPYHWVETWLKGRLKLFGFMLSETNILRRMTHCGLCSLPVVIPVKSRDSYAIMLSCLCFGSFNVWSYWWWVFVCRTFGGHHFHKFLNFGDINKVKRRWPGELYSACFTSHARGLMILIHCSFPFQLLNTFIDPSRRYLMVPPKADVFAFECRNFLFFGYVFAFSAGRNVKHW